jgi:hypothetical protein
MMNEDNQAPEQGLVLYQKPNSGPTVPLELTILQPSSPETAPKGATQRLDAVAFDKRGLPNRIQFLVRESGAILEKAARAPLIIGRYNSSLPVDIDLAEYNAHEMGISRNHFRIEPAPGGKLMVIDLKTVNGTQLNGEKLDALRPYELRHGDELKAGRLHLKVYFIY